jgi:curved DNA-binding protein CbpA
MADAPDPYKVLQVDPEAEDEVIQAAYRRLAQKYHPDLATGSDAIERMVAINAAWELIGEPERRAAHDRSARERAAWAGSPPAAAGGTSPPGGGGSTSQPKDVASAGGRAAGQPAGPPPPPPTQRPPETVSTEWTSGRSTTGSGYDASTMRAPDGLGAAGPPPGNPSGSVLNFGRYAGWSLGEISRSDIEYIEWLDRVPIGRQYREETDPILRKAGRRKSATTDASERRGLFRRR